MGNVAKARDLLRVVKMIAIHLTDEELLEIGLVLEKAITRLEKEEVG